MIASKVDTTVLTGLGLAIALCGLAAWLTWKRQTGSIAPSSSARTSVLLPSSTIPDFEHFAYQIAVVPPGARLRAWDRLQACERRLAMYGWVEDCNDKSNPEFITWLDDEVGTFLLVFESAVQFLSDEYEAKFGENTFGDWFSKLAENDAVVRGLRTLRHFEAHVESKPVAGNVTLDLGKPTPTGGPTVIRRWSLQSLDATELQRLSNPQLKTSAQIDEWRKRVETDDNRTLFAHGLRQLVAMVRGAESIL
jgi:hypothetical protein